MFDWLIRKEWISGALTSRFSLYHFITLEKSVCKAKVI